MQAAIINDYGSASAFAIQSMPEPHYNKNQILVQVKAAGLNPLDFKMRQGKLKMLMNKKFPKILGADFAGIVAGTGSNVKKFKTGDYVYGMMPYYATGSYGEYAPVNQLHATHIPQSISFIEAAALPLASLTSYQALIKSAGINQPMSILVNGASGGVGHIAIQMCRATGLHITGICSAQNHSFVQALGCDEVIDYHKQSPDSLAGPYDIIFDVAGKLKYTKVHKLLNKKGTYMSTLPGVDNLITGRFMSFFHGKECKLIAVTPSGKDLFHISKLVENGQLKPYIQEALPFSEITQCHEKLETENTTGKIVLYW